MEFPDRDLSTEYKSEILQQTDKKDPLSLDEPNISIIQ